MFTSHKFSTKYGTDAAKSWAHPPVIIRLDLFCMSPTIMSKRQENDCMDLHHEFIVNVPIDKAWAILTDIELIAPCLPGAQLTAAQGETYFGNVKVKVGPILAKFEGQASFIERDDVQHRAVLKGEGRDGSGKGNASALITASLVAVSENSSKCSVETDLTISGKIGQFGRGALADVSDKILAQFVNNLNTKILGS